MRHIWYGVAVILSLLILQNVNGERISANENLFHLVERLQAKIESMETANTRVMEMFNSKMEHMQKENIRLHSIIEELGGKHLPRKSKANEPINCFEIKASNPGASSGNYMIDPDGADGEAAFEVYCDMTNGNTQVPHNSESPMAVTQCADPGCYSRKVVYGTATAPITPAQAAKLFEVSEGCRQSIRYDCTFAPFAFNGIQYSWWLDRDGNRQYYWSGNDNTEHVCQCGLDGNCIDSTVKCNCDALNLSPESDAGTLTSKLQLPVTELAFGRTSNSISTGNHTLGRFECFGKKRFTEKPKNCNELSQIGHLNGYYWLPKDTNAMKVVYCDMLEGASEREIGVVDVQTTSVYFDAVQESSVSINPTDPAIKYSKTLINEGNAMNITTGTFTAPVSGVYAFSFTASGDANSIVTMVVDTQTVGASSPRTTFGTLVMHVETALTAGQTVNVQLRGAGLSAANNQIHFSGALLRGILVDP